MIQDAGWVEAGQEPDPIAMICARAVAAVAGGMSRHAAAKVFSVGVSSVIRWCQRKRETGSFSPKPIGGSRGYRIEGEDRDWLLRRIAEQPDLTLEEMRRELLAERGLAASHGAVWRFCEREQLTFKKLCTPRSKSGLTSPRPARCGASNSRRWTSSAWCSSTRPGPRTNMVRLYGRCPRGRRLLDKVPLARWETTTFVAALRWNGLTAPMVLDGPINGEWFLAYVEQVLCPTLLPGDIVILDWLGSHRSPKVREAIETRGASPLYLPKYSPDPNPIEMAFSKLKALLRKAAERSTEALWNRIGQLLDAFTPNDCANYFKAAGYGAA